MTNPIPGADSERAACEAQWAIESGGKDFESLGYRYWLGWKARAAAKVGANVAADVRNTISNAIYGYGCMVEDHAGVVDAIAKAIAAGAPARERSPYVLGVKPSNWAEQVATGAPAETPKPSMSKKQIDDIVYQCRQSGKDTTYDVVNAALAAQPAPAPSADSDLVKRLQGQVNDLQKLLTIRKSSDERMGRLAPIAGADVEKDAARIQFLEDNDVSLGAVSVPAVGDDWDDEIQVIEHSTDASKVIGTGTTVREAIDAARAAMLAASSPAEAG